MNANELRTILLVKAVEEVDTDGTLLPPAEREAATREALRRVQATQVSDESVTARAWSVLSTRAADLCGRLTERHPVIRRSLALESGLAGIGVLLVGVAFVFGLALSLGDRRMRIELLATPLLGVVLWNVVVYALYATFAVRALRHRNPAHGSTGALRSMALWPVHWTWRRATALAKRSDFHHRALAAALRKFADAWWPFAQPALTLQAQRAYHLAAAALAAGLVAGLYVHGVAFEYRAGWESTFLDATQVGTVMRWLYGPAAALTGIALPAGTDVIGALRWRDGAGGGLAAPWIHLTAVTALLYVVLPRAVLAAWSSVRLVRVAGRVAPPETLQPYLRAVLDRSDAALPPAVVRVTTYAFKPDAASLEGLQRALRAAFGRDARLERAPDVAYGDEPQFAPRTPAADVEAVVFSLAATPESENHGAILAAARREARRPLILVDESSFLARMRGDATLETRVGQRRDAWRRFVGDHGLAACLVDCSGLADGAVPAGLADEVRRCARGVAA